MPRDVRVRKVNSGCKNCTSRETSGELCFCLFVFVLFILEEDSTLLGHPLRSRGIRLAFRKICLPVFSWGSVEIEVVAQGSSTIFSHLLLEITQPQFNISQLFKFF